MTVYILGSTEVQQISTKLGQNLYGHKISDDIDNGLNQRRKNGVISP